MSAGLTSACESRRQEWRAGLLICHVCCGRPGWLGDPFPPHTLHHHTTVLRTNLLLLENVREVSGQLTLFVCTHALSSLTAGFLALLDEPETDIKLFALQKLNQVSIHVHRHPPSRSHLFVSFVLPSWYLKRSMQCETLDMI